MTSSVLRSRAGERRARSGGACAHAVPRATLIVGAALLTGCARPHAGCTKDTDCKGERVCNSGLCTDPSGPTSATSTVGSPSPLTVNPAPVPHATSTASSASGSSEPVRYAPDGLPEHIPSPGSGVPTLAEWSAVPRQVPVRGSSRLNCETKMVREWLRVTCLKNAKGNPVEVYDESGQRAFTFTGYGKNSVVLRVIHGEVYKTRYVWDKDGKRSGAQLVVSWPADVARPELYFVED